MSFYEASQFTKYICTHYLFSFLPFPPQIQPHTTRDAKRWCVGSSHSHSSRWLRKVSTSSVFMASIPHGRVSLFIQNRGIEGAVGENQRQIKLWQPHQSAVSRWCWSKQCHKVGLLIYEGNTPRIYVDSMQMCSVTSYFLSVGCPSAALMGLVRLQGIPGRLQGPEAQGW